MSLDASAREANIKDSFKKYFWDNLYSVENIAVSFDRWLTAPKFQGVEVDRWVAIKLGNMDRSSVSEIFVEIYCCARRDPEGFKRAQLTDKVMGYLADDTQTDGLRRIPFYQSREIGAWTLIGSFVVTEHRESRELELSDGTKYKIITARILVASKI